MYQSRIVSSLVLCLVIGTPACGARFVSFGDEDAGTGDQNLGTGGSGRLGAGGSLPGVGGGIAVIGSGGSLPGVGGGIAVTGSGGSLPGVGGGMATAGAGGYDCVCTGDAPKMVNYVCPDGSIAGPVCDRYVVDECTWFIRECPSISGVGGSAGVGGASPVGGGSSNGINCSYNGALYIEGQSFPAIDGCNTCYCTAAGTACTSQYIC